MQIVLLEDEGVIGIITESNPNFVSYYLENIAFTTMLNEINYVVLATLDSNDDIELAFN